VQKLQGGRGEAWREFNAVLLVCNSGSVFFSSGTGKDFSGLRGLPPRGAREDNFVYLPHDFSVRILAIEARDGL